MSKTKQLRIICNEARIVPNRYNQVVAHIDDPNVNDALLSFHSDDLIEFVASNYDVEEVYGEKELTKWAADNGYVKQ
jgi:predicted AlkP superfamily phosphohydrolase/phosphomutase